MSEHRVLLHLLSLSLSFHRVTCYGQGALAIESFEKAVKHQSKTISAEWTYSVADNFIVKQLPTLVTWSLSLLYARQTSPTAAYQLDVVEGGALGHNLRYVASAVSHIFLASGEVLDLVKRLRKLSGYTQRVTELEDVLLAASDLRTTSGNQVRNGVTGL